MFSDKFFVRVGRVLTFVYMNAPIVLVLRLLLLFRHVSLLPHYCVVHLLLKFFTMVFLMFSVYNNRCFYLFLALLLELLLFFLVVTSFCISGCFRNVFCHSNNCGQITLVKELKKTVTISTTSSVNVCLCINITKLKIIK